MKPLHLLTLIFFVFSINFLHAQHLFSVTQNELSQEELTQLTNRIANMEVGILSSTKNSENEEVYPMRFSSIFDTKIIILNEQTGKNIVIMPKAEYLTELQLTPFFIEELRQGALGDADFYFVIETDTDFSVKHVSTVPASNGEVFIPRYFYGKKENVQEALPQERQIVSIYKQKPQLILANPDDPELQTYALQWEEERSYYIYIYELPDGTRATYDTHFSQSTEKQITGVGNHLEFILTGTLNATQRLATEYALELWSEQIAGTVPVRIEVNLFSMGEGVLGSTFFPQCFLNPDNGIWYPSSLWDQLVGYDASGEADKDIEIWMNSDYSFYFGLDGVGSGNDFVTIMLHEITHGFGFGCRCSADNGEFDYGGPNIYDCMLYQGLTGPCFTELPNYERAALMISNNLYAGAPNSNLLEANEGVRVKIYAPTTYKPGSSAHHWDNDVSFTTFMKYAYAGPLHTFNNRKLGILTDMGWQLPVIDPNAVWLTYNNNGGSGTILPQQFLPGVAQNLKINPLIRKGHTFMNWNTLPDGTGISYQDRASITITNDTELFAQWEANTYRLSFFTNGGTVSPTSIQVIYGEPVGELPIPEKEGYIFDKWKIGTLVITEQTVWNFPQDRVASASWTKIDDIEETEYQTALQIVPNPTTGELRILMNNEQLIMNNVEMFDISGRKLSFNHRINTSSNHLINVSHLQSGTYFLRITTENGTITKKFVKQ